MEALDDYIAKFAGYGNLGAPLWFIGMEEGGGKDVLELERRVRAWAARGRLPLEDLAGFHHVIGASEYFLPPYPLQRTWRSLCRTLQAWLGSSTDTASIKNAQAHVLGAFDGKACLLELLPLPATDISSWPYVSLALEHPALSDRTRYTAAYTRPRTEMLRALTTRAQPIAVVFYGLRYLESWATIAGQVLAPTSIGNRMCYAGPNQRPFFVAVPHPVARGMTNDFWIALGAHIRSNTGERPVSQ